MNWNNFILQVADDKASALVFGTRRRIESPAQYANIKFGKGLRALHNGLDKAMPGAIARAKARKDKQYIQYLESQGYTVLSPQETKELETFPGDLCDLNLAIGAMRKADAAIE
jgi:hypothetical protein